MSTKQEIFEDKKKQFVAACQHTNPDRVPILSMVNNFAIGYAGKTIYDCFKDQVVERACWTKVYNDVYFDGLYSFGTNLPFKAFIEDLETETYFVSENKQTIQHSSSSHMTLEEYDELIENPIKYIANKVGYRKLAALRKPYPENYDALKKALQYVDNHAKNVAANRKYVLEELGLPVITAGNLSHPLDMFFDYVRGFKDTLTDMRRCPDKVSAAVEAMIPLYSSALPAPNSREEYPYIFNTCHIPTFLNTKQFEKFYWPYYKTFVTKTYEAGTRLMSFCEGKWEQHYDFLNDLPKGALIDLVEGDDIFKTKKMIGDNVIIAGGMSTGVLKYGTVQDCKDYAKQVIDECAPGSGFIFATDKTLLNNGDVKIENLIEVNKFVHEYGAY